jgi:hypothetical protein
MEDIIQQEISIRKGILGASTIVICAALGGLLEVSLLFTMADAIDKKDIKSPFGYTHNITPTNYPPQSSYSNQQQIVNYAPHEILSDLEK